jgi:alkanesulfonate monooxygenase SsuD/methylene tetrahydromethanopterin reductase-like flavin-dependent oxidoreductase (luciferase family)
VPDHGRPIAFGYFLVPDADAPLLATAAEAEARGLDYVAVQDHPYQRRYVDAISLLGMIAGRTHRIGLFPDVANLPLRPPAVLAKTAASLDMLSGGRFELGLGAGGFWDAIEAYGGPRRAPAEALGALDEGIQVIRKVWSGERNLRFTGRHYQLKGAQSGPLPAHPIGIWLGVYGPKAIALAGRVADGWVPSLRGDAGDTIGLRDTTMRLDEAAAAAGRQPGDIRRVVNVNGAVT